ATAVGSPADSAFDSGSRQEAAVVRSAGVPPAASAASCRQSDDAPPDTAVAPGQDPGCGGEDAATTAGGTPALQPGGWIDDEDAYANPKSKIDSPRHSEAEAGNPK